jgi:anti-anti-sigma factor
MTAGKLPVRWSGRHVVVTMPAEIDAANAAVVAGQLSAVLSEHPDLITADLTGTTFCDSAGVQAIARAAEQSAASRAEMRIALGDSPVARVFQLTGLDQVMPVYRDVQQSLDAPRLGQHQPARPVPAGQPQAGRPRAALPEIQAALLPAALPVLPQVRIAARYLAAAEDDAAGGDWFDAVPLAGGSVAVIVGDVAGHGVAAVAAMGQLRAVLNDLLVAEPNLATVLGRADAFAARFPELRAATLVLAVLDPADGTLQYATCGHEAPLRVSNGRVARFLAGTGAGPLGTGSAPVLASTSLRPGELVLLYSNGLTRRPARTPEEGLADLAKVATDAMAEQTVPAASAPTAADRVCQLTVDLLAGAGYQDDVTTLAVQWRPGPAPELHIERRAETGTVRAMRHSLSGWLSQLDPLLRSREALLLAVTEIITNAVEHAYPAGQSGVVCLDASVSGSGEFECRIVDHGTWRVPDPGIPWRGQGLMVAAQVVDQLQVQHLPQDAVDPPGTRGTVVTLRHQLSRPAMLAVPAVPEPAVRAAGPPFSVTAGIEGPSATATVSGPLDISTADRLAGQLLAACRGGTLPLTVDLRQVTLLTSAGVRTLHQISQQLNAHHRELTLLAEPGSLAETVLALAGLPAASTTRHSPS